MNFSFFTPARSWSRSWSLRRQFSTSIRVLQDVKGPETLQSELSEPDVKPGELGPLSRPLGVTERPTTLVKTRTQKAVEILTDSDARIAHRRHLIKEVSKGYYYDMNMTRKHGGKTWIAPKSLILENKALYLPNVKGRSIDTGEEKNTTIMCFGRITVLSMLGTRMSEVHSRGFVTPTHERYSSNPLYQHIQINLQENILKNLLVKVFLRSLRNVVPQELHPTYLVSGQNMEYVRDMLGMTNNKVGYVYLIDENLKIRWGGCADATPEEVAALQVCTGVLLNRLEKAKGKPKNVEKSSESTDKTISSK
ncbi:hypothetical protein E4T56_gene20852 [Termitomyces sp. T112]|nr:hypothetical protein E4T56_gene20852 [Termitomyces sp. T112]KAH0580959.1 hypothetical protein H2248_012112 [Termitomyces sp. 'cryptogamus']